MGLRDASHSERVTLEAKLKMLQDCQTQNDMHLSSGEESLRNLKEEIRALTQKIEKESENLEDNKRLREKEKAILRIQQPLPDGTEELQSEMRLGKAAEEILASLEKRESLLNQLRERQKELFEPKNEGKLYPECD